MVLLPVLQWLLRPVWSLFHALFGLVWPRRGSDRLPPVTQHGENICRKQISQYQAVMEEFEVIVPKPTEKSPETQEILENLMSDSSKKRWFGERKHEYLYTALLYWVSLLTKSERQKDH